MTKWSSKIAKESLMNSQIQSGYGQGETWYSQIVQREEKVVQDVQLVLRLLISSKTTIRRPNTAKWSHKRFKRSWDSWRVSKADILRYSTEVLSWPSSVLRMPIRAQNGKSHRGLKASLGVWRLCHRSQRASQRGLRAIWRSLKASRSTNKGIW